MMVVLSFVRSWSEKRRVGEDTHGTVFSLAMRGGILLRRFPDVSFTICIDPAYAEMVYHYRFPNNTKNLHSLLGVLVLNKRSSRDTRLRHMQPRDTVLANHNKCHAK
jgi:hypothetical protein